jgi:hypothetical protein
VGGDERIVRTIAPHSLLAIRGRGGVFQFVAGGAKKQRRDPSGRLQRQNSPSGLGCASL